MNRTRNTLLLAGLLLVTRVGFAQDEPEALPEVPQVKNAYGTWPKVVVGPLVFPVLGKCQWHDSFGAPRSGGRKHQGQDLMAPKMTPLVAAFDGTVHFQRTDAPNVHNVLYLRGENGWSAAYMHINNDTPGTDDGLGSADYAFAPGLQSGERVVAGQFLAWVGDSGNAESTGPHCHFELSGPPGTINAAPSLLLASQMTEPRWAPLSPTLKPEPGETRLDGALRSVNPERGLLCLDLIATQPHGKQAEVATAPARRWVRLGGVRLEGVLPTEIRVSSEPGSAAPLAEVPRGSRIVAMVKYKGPTTAAPGSRVALLSRAEGRVASVVRRAGPPRLKSAPAQKADATLPFLKQPDGVQFIADADVPGRRNGRVILAGGWDTDFLRFTIRAPEGFRGKLEIGGLLLYVGEEGVLREDGSDVPGAGCVVTETEGGETLLRVMLPLTMLPEDLTVSEKAGPALLLRADVDLESGPRASIPPRGTLAVRLSGK